MKRLYTYLLLFLANPLAFANFGSKRESLGSISQNMLQPINWLRYAFNIASILLGVYMLLSAFTRYKRFRENPQESPLSTVIFWAFLGIVLIVIPILYMLSVQAARATGAGDLV